jgi:starch synthase (maltosyl-transferring)
MDTMQVDSGATVRRAKLPFRLREVTLDQTSDLQAAAREAANAGFDGLLLPCPFATENGLPADMSRADARFGGGPIETIAPLMRRISEATGLALIVDLPIAVVAAGSPLYKRAPERFLAPDPAGLLDPRLPLALDRVRVKLSSEEDIAFYGSTLSSIVGGLAMAGIDGFRLLGLSALTGPTISRLISSIRIQSPGTILIAHTPGMTWDALATIDASLFDYSVASSAWWNRKDSWFYDELDHLRRVAPPLIPASTAPSDGGGRDEDRIARDLGLSASLGAGWIYPAGADLAAVSGRIAALNTVFRRHDAAACMAAPGLAHLNGVHGTVLATLRTDAGDPRAAENAIICLLNTNPRLSAAIDPASFLPALGGLFSVFTGDAGVLTPGRTVTLEAGELALFAARALPAPSRPALTGAEATAFAATHGRLAIEAAAPSVDGGAFPVKRIAGELVPASADIICDGHDKLSARLQWRGPGETEWSETALLPVGNDRWQAAFPLSVVGLHHYRIVAWRDAFATFRDELAKKHAAGVPTSLEIREGTSLVEDTLGSQHLLSGRLSEAPDDDARRAILLDEETASIMRDNDPRPHAVTNEPIPVDAERTGAGYASWYEIFPRSASGDVNRHGTFRDVEAQLPRIRAMGFDVLYFPPVHPIGKTNRKGPNNTLTPGPDDHGSPYAIGSADGGHDALHPKLGTFEGFARLKRVASDHGLELAIDFAIQCSPDHPWLTEHKDWFTWRPDGTIKYAENPPKKYQDIVNVDFYTGGSVPGLWLELANVVLFWCEHGIRLFRVDNPHTKAFPFWQWMIGEVRARYPDAVFLAEAFTRPKVMARLAKIGFSQSYTYFTWRNTKAEIEAYLTELADGPARDYFRPHFFVNTPDINPFFLQNSGRPGFLIRAALAATLSGLWGVYNGFELCEGTPLAPGKEEYLDSEKFQLRAWDWDRPGNIVAEITRLNAVRKANTALQTHLGVTFLMAHNDAILFFEKATPDRSNVVLVAISVDPFNTQQATIELPLWKSGLPDHGGLDLEDQLADNPFRLTGKYQTITLTPDRPYAIWRLA